MLLVICQMQQAGKQASTDAGVMKHLAVGQHHARIRAMRRDVVYCSPVSLRPRCSISSLAQWRAFLQHPTDIQSTI